MNLHIDLGQIILIVLGAFVSIIGYLIKSEISAFSKRLDKIEERYLDLAGSLQRLIGHYSALTGNQNSSKDQL